MLLCTMEYDGAPVLALARYASRSAPHPPTPLPFGIELMRVVTHPPMSRRAVWLA